MERLKEFSLYIVGGFFLTGISMAFDSVFLEVYLRENLITLLVALLAINTTTSSVVMTKLKEIADAANNGNFKSTIEQLKLSIYEQVSLIGIAVFFLILSCSENITEFHEWVPFILNGVIASVFVAGLCILKDTAESIFVILRYEGQDK